MPPTSRSHRAAAALCVATITVAACDWRSEAERDAMANESSRAIEAPSPGGELREDAADMTMDSETFVAMAAAESLLEVRLAEVVQRAEASPAARDLARDLAADHAAANEELARIAEAHAIPMPVDLPPDKQQTVDHLSELSGDELTAEYAHTLQVGHRSALELYRQAVATPEVAPDLKAFAASKLGALEQHLSRAEALGADSP
jgi:predicted outer membrane protein